MDLLVLGAFCPYYKIIFLKSTSNSAFFYTHHEGVWKKNVWTPLMCRCAFLRPRQGTRTRSKNFFCWFRMFYIKMKLLQGDRTPKKFFIQNQLILVYSASISKAKFISSEKIQTEHWNLQYLYVKSVFFLIMLASFLATIKRGNIFSWY
jgi:hypothetical protein